MTQQPTVPIVAYDALSPYLAEQLGRRFIVHTVAADVDPASSAGDVKEARALVSFGSVGASAAVMDALPGWEMIALFSAGYDKVDVDHAWAKGKPLATPVV